MATIDFNDSVRVLTYSKRRANRRLPGWRTFHHHFTRCGSNRTEIEKPVAFPCDRLVHSRINKNRVSSSFSFLKSAIFTRTSPTGMCDWMTKDSTISNLSSHTRQHQISRAGIDIRYSFVLSLLALLSGNFERSMPTETKVLIHWWLLLWWWVCDCVSTTNEIEKNVHYYEWPPFHVSTPSSSYIYK